jgi:alkyl sulfatase BDS1-like metallo-beta-lactamase superfamily hydrolase
MKGAMMATIRSFDPDGSAVATAPGGQLAHRGLLAQLEVIDPGVYTVRDGVWCVVGNGLSNQTFVEGPDGIIAIDTGESVEEMQAAVRALREFSDRPVVAVIYSHFHYVSGTAALNADGLVAVVGHERIVANLARASGEIGPAYRRGVVQQFGVNLPASGPDGLVHVGLGLWLRNPAHAPFTPGFVPPTMPVSGPINLALAGLRVEITPAPSDADDSVTIWFPDLDTVVHNLVWPALYNVFAIRGEEYRDPQVLLTGIDHLLELAPEYLVGTHGPPLSGRDEIRRRVTGVRDAIQFLWDQTVRGINRGWTTDELAWRVRLPDGCTDDYLTSERYGVAEHHVRQIHNGLRGWFDGDESKLFPLEPADRYARLIAGFGGRDAVRRQASAALESDDLRWAAELATWLTRSDDAADDDRRLLAAVLRAIGQRTPAANIRNWCLTRARDLDGTAPMSRLRVHRLSPAAVRQNPAGALRTLRVLLDPQRAAGIDHHVAFTVDGHPIGGLHMRNSVACPTDGAGADTVITATTDAYVALLTGATPWAELHGNGAITVDGDRTQAEAVVASFDLNPPTTPP